MKLKAVLFLTLSLSYFSGYMQDNEQDKDEPSFREKFEAANSLMEDNLYEFAKELWLELVKEDSLNANVHYKTGYCLLKTAHNKKDALYYLNKAKSKIDPKYNPYDFTNKSAPNEIYYYLGKSHHLNNDPDSAIKYFNIFIETAGKKHYLREFVFHDIKQCEVAKQLIANPNDYSLQNIGGTINSSFSDFSPVLTVDESAIFFTSRRLRTDTNHSSNKDIYSPQDGKHFEDVYVSYKNFKTNKWDTPELLDFSSPNSNQASISVSGDGEFLYIYKDDGDGNGDIYISEREDVKYGPLTKLDAVNSKAWETHVTISMNGQTMYFVSDREGGFGGRDIYRCVKLPNGEWSQALNIGPPINTPYDEDSPFLHPDGKTFYFSSNGEQSMGGFDIFYSQMFEEGTWSLPKNMGSPLNTVEDDLFFTTSVDGKHGYYASSHDGGFGETDIYKILFDKSESEPLAILKGYIDPGSLDEIPPGIMIWVSDLTEGDDPMQYTPNRKNGSYVFSLIPCHEYLVEYTQNSISFYETEFKLPCEADYHEINKVITIGGIPLNKDDTTNTETADKTKSTESETANTSGSDNESKTNNDSNDNESSLESTDKENEIKIDPVEFQIYYGYNQKGIENDIDRFNNFIIGINKIIDLKGSVEIELEGSASTVPTQTYSSNNNLANQRTKEAKEILKEKLKENGVDLSKFKIVSENSLVQGPKYQADYLNKKKYGKYQYIKIKAF